MIIVIDYDAGNLRSVETALSHLGAEYRVSAVPEEILRADKLIFPGVGEAAHAMGVLRARGLDTALADAVASGVPTLGICIGSQILLDESLEADEGRTACLGIEAGTARFFTEDFSEAGISGLKVPHMGWNQVRLRPGHPASVLFDGIPDGSSFYFVHSYYPAPADEDVALAYTEYGFDFVSAYGRGNLAATQFHPEKSGEIGLRLLDNFIRKFGGKHA
jgi:glutamine amidotransferase